MKNLFINNQGVNAEISQNGIEWKAVSKEDLTNILNTLKQDIDNAIIYSRDNPTLDVSSQAIEIFKIIESARLPIKLVKRKGSDGTGESETNDEPSYANCLLVTLAKSPGTVAIIKSGQGVPDIENLSKNQSELPWIRGLPFNYSQLRADIVINMIIRIPSKKIGIFGNNHELIAKMILSEDKAESVRFLVKQSKSKDGIQQLEISRIVS